MNAPTITMSKFFLICGVLAFALPSQLRAGDTAAPSKRWSLETSFQAHSVAGPSSPWMGIGGLFQIVDFAQLGLRGFVPITKPFDRSTYSIQGFARARLFHGAQTDLFFEPEYAQNFYTVLPFYSLGAAFGASTEITPSLRLGATGGIEMAKVVVDSVGLERRTTFVVYPKLSLFANFSF